MQSSLRFQHFADDGPQYFVPPTTGVQNDLPVFTWDQAGAQITRDGWTWSPALGTPVTVTYAFRISAAGATTAEFPAGVNDAQRNFAAIGNQNLAKHSHPLELKGALTPCESKTAADHTQPAGRWSPEF